MITTSGEMISSEDYQRRFAGVARLYGTPALAHFAASHVCVVGIGGVGSWAVEALARSAIGHFTLVDLDHIAPSNVNRQLHAVSATFGAAKVSIMAQRIHTINPRAQVHEVDDFLTLDNLAQLMSARRFDYVLDCIDQTAVKIALAAYCQQQKIPLIMSGAAGGRRDATRIQIGDLAHTRGDALLANIRGALRRKHGFPLAMPYKKSISKKFNIEAVFSEEPLLRPKADCAVAGKASSSSPIGGLHCDGYGSAVVVTASFGMVMAGRVLTHLASGVSSPISD